MKKIEKIKRHRLRTRSKLITSASRPRLSVHKTHQHIYAQIIDDLQNQTLVYVSDQHLKSSQKLTKIKKAEAVGQLLGQKALAKKITKVAFDRGSFPYHGRIKALAEKARKAGLKF